MTEHREQQTPRPRRARLSRRRFMIGAGLAVAGGGLLPVATSTSFAAEAAEAAPLRDLARLGREDFATLVGQSFTIDTAAGRHLTVRLTAVEMPSARPVAMPYPQPRLDCFTLLFRGPAPSLSQGTYRMTHVRLGTFPIFLVSRSLSRGGTEYTAAFNRLLP